ncbi:MAG TPA: D-alanyl-D-alanine carboxypeptidase [Gammaproteobacteria bacterium]|nr:D-alanyl-D-alanine carboxypeptidase [Gammaproteobacteria bacterium]
MIRKVFYFCLALFLSYFLTGNESFIPDPPSIGSSNYILIDSTTNRILAQKNPDERIEPASITKIMTGYVVSDQVEEGFINLQDEVFISENCWRKEGSKMWIREGTTVSLLDLIKGMVIQSGNDASCAIAEHVAGSEENFVELMMKYVKRMGLSNTNFVNATGWPEENHYSSARDIAKLSSLLIKDFPEHYSLYKEKSFTYNNIPQRNRNALLWQDDSIDGIKTGHTETAGFCLVSSGKRDDTRLISVIIKSNSEKTRLTDTRRLLDYGFRYFRTKKIVSKGQKLKEEQVWGGESDSVFIAPSRDFYLTLPLRDFKKIEPLIVLNDYLQAPLSEGQVVGKMLFKLGAEDVGSIDLIAVEEIKGMGIFGKAWSNIKLLVYRFLMEED